ncbi:MAG: AgmX/PglI C-terminal domain-containing protein [Deltaproteobacteria bacterium]|nr:MAG: AgmX/PglI C-terminal domain-containing protein [Deltaproteobacteria bacterium]
MAAPYARPNQAPSPGPKPRILRVGVLLGGKIVEERLIRERAPVTIGQSMRNTFSIPVEGLPLEFTLFALDEHRYSLRFLPRMDGRLSDSGGQVHTLDALKSHGAQSHGSYFEVPLTESARGKLSLGDLTILFQFVTEPPRQPKPMLPASVRGTFADRFDPRLSVIMGSSIIIHFAIVIVALFADVEVDNGIAERAYNLTFKQDTYAVDLTPQKAADQGPGSAAEKKPDKAPDQRKAPERGDSGRSKADQVALQEQEASKFADLLTGEGLNGTSEGDMSKRRPGADLGAQINEVREGGQTVKVGGGAGRTSRGDGDIRVGTGHGPNINGPGGTESAGGGKTQEKAPTGRISVADKQTFDESTLTPDIVLAKIQSAYMAGLKRCYKEFLKKDASARGKVTLNLTVNETGRTTKGAAHGFAGEVDECISGLMSGWRFPIPKDKDGEATEASFAITLQLVPD